MKRGIIKRLKINKWLKIGLLGILASMVMCVLTVFLATRPVVLKYLGHFLVHEEPLSSTADYIVVLMGDPTVRPKFAAELVKNGVGQKLAFTQSETNRLEELGELRSESTMTQSIAKKAGLKDDQIEMILNQGRVSSTQEEAIAFKKYFESLDPPPQNVVFVTSWFHTSRANWIIQKVFQGSKINIGMLGVPEIPFRYDNWWQSEEGMICVFVEYAKYGRYLAKYAGRSLKEP